MLEQVHKPVLVNEVLKAFKLDAPLNYQKSEKVKKTIIDATLGGGGHTIKLLKKRVFVLGLDADEKMIRIAGSNIRNIIACPTGNCDDVFKLVNENFTSIDTVAKENGFSKVDGILFDLGISSYHYLFNDKGFSFQDPNAELDMRLSQSIKVTAKDLLNALNVKALEELFAETLSGYEARKISKLVVSERTLKNFQKVGDFTKVLDKIFRKVNIHKRKNISSYTLPFLALRIAVNSELDNLKDSLPKAWKLLGKGGVLAVISFHSGEDRIVKEFFKDKSLANEVSKEVGPIIPDKREILDNPRSRSAKLRYLIKK